MLDLGFETIGNATVLCHDKGPLLVTDPWLEGGAYFGSWKLTHEPTPAQRESIKNCPYVWFSHGHPDHLNGESVSQFLGKQILLPDHADHRIRDDLQAQGFNVKVLKDREWIKLSDRVKICCIADYNQDALLLVSMNNRLLVNLNDCAERGWLPFVKKAIAAHEKSFMLALTGYGDADMINFFDEEGKHVEPLAAKRFPVGKAITEKAEALGVTHFIPFSSHHKYQRTDSAWVNQYTTKLSDYGNGFTSKTVAMMPAFIEYNCLNDEWRESHPPKTSDLILEPEQFGDNWTDALDASDIAKIEKYFRSFDHLKTFLDFVNLRVGGKDHTISIGKQNFKRGVSFEVPRHSLMIAVQYEIFDDLLIGNFMKTSLHGKWPRSGLHPDFTPFLRYGDNGKAKTKEEIQAYFKEYQQRAFLDYFRHRVEQGTKDIFRLYVSQDSQVFQKAKKLYWNLKSLR